MGNWGKEKLSFFFLFFDLHKNTCWKKSVQLEERARGRNAFWGVTSHTLSMSLSVKASPPYCHHNTINACDGAKKKNSQSINNVVSDHKKPRCSPTEHFTLSFLQYTPSAPKARCSFNAEYAMKHSQLHHISASSAQAERSKICISNIFYLHPK